ncbi:HAMP domain-containing sensor histidine kinase [Tenacibaculum sp. FZY0031]|uniref:sensor histidine kinase n=1 Tax=Tenacibaculum sp. FZY0031 TaxID=3116648 RepID=UPI002EA0422B|nr:HAMP domain-containing sensor histidine kinase [Tenacibaculum sp. FZY0031]
MKSFNFKYIILLIGLSSLGIILFQMNWLRESYNITDKNFKESVLQSLKSTKNVIETYRAKNNITLDGDVNTAYSYSTKDSLYNFNFYSVSKFDFIPNYDNQFYNTMEALQKEFVKRKNTSKSFNESVMILYFQKDTISSNDYEQIKVDSVINNSLLANNIELKHTFGFRDKKSKKWNYVGGEILKDTILLEKSNYILDTIDNEDIHLIFYNKRSFLYKSLLLNIIVSTLLVLIILFSFWYALRIILKQKHLSQIKTDFINNMTHEFKTPLASISMATATIEEPEVIKNELVIKQLTKVIKEENERMNRQVEMILKIAQDDKLISKLDKKDIDVNEIIKSIVAQNNVRVEKKNGIIKYVAAAKDFIISADEIHIYQAINNLVDNAIKYSYNNIDIKVTSENKDEYLVINVTDKGVGIKKEDEQRIFEKFYRVSTKDVHNVKGFGLGLNYVKQIAEAHNGYVTLNSNKLGSTFSLFLPLNK